MGLFSSRATPRSRVEPTFSDASARAIGHNGGPALDGGIRAASPENPSTSLSNPDAWLVDWATGGATFAGPPVSERTAMAVSAVYACTKLISGLIAGIPLKIYRDMPDGGRQESSDHRLARLLGQVPFPGRPLTSFLWREMWGVNTCLWGNHYSIIRYDMAARVIGFEPIPPWNVEVFRRDYLNWYRCVLEDGTTEMVAFDDMIHIPGLGFDGIKGVSRIQAFARNAVGLAKTLESQVGYVHENAARPSGMVGVPPGISDPAFARMKASFDERFTGRHNAGKVIYADAGSEYTPFQMSPEDLNTLEFRKYQSADICRFYGVPPHLIGEPGDTTAWGTGIEQLTLGFLKFGLESDLQRIEHELNAKLLFGTNYYAMFDRDALLAMDALTAAKVMQTQVNSGLLTPNEGRRKINRAAVKGGDNLFVNSTMITLDRAITGPPPPAAPAKPKEPDNAS